MVVVRAAAFDPDPFHFLDAQAIVLPAPVVIPNRLIAIFRTAGRKLRPIEGASRGVILKTTFIIQRGLAREFLRRVLIGLRWGEIARSLIRYSMPSKQKPAWIQPGGTNGFSSSQSS